MFDDFLVVAIGICLLAAVFYRLQVFHTRKLGYFSLLQIIYLVIIPSLLLPLVFSYALSLTELELHREAFISDRLLLILLMLSSCFVYGGIAIHAVAKMMADPQLLRYDDTEAGKMNRYFHLTFSHNLIYSGIIAVVVCLMLLEINHVPPSDAQRVWAAIIKGIMLGAPLVVGLFFYTRSPDAEYGGRWADLKLFFATLWIGVMLALYAIQRIDPVYTDYQLLLPALICGALLGFLNIVLVGRRLKRGGFALAVNWERLKAVLFS